MDSPIVLLVGNVDLAASLPVMDFLARQGVHAETLHVSTKFAIEGDFHRWISEGYRPSSADSDDREVDRLKRLAISLIFPQEWPPNNVVAVVMEAPPSHMTSSQFMGWLFDFLPTDIAVQVVYTGENGERYSDGGFGCLEVEILDHVEFSPITAVDRPDWA